MNNKYVVLRGGSWFLNQGSARADYRLATPPNNRFDRLGFRVMKKSDQSYRVVRGGSWISGARICRSAYHLRYQPDNRSGILGFRVINRKERKI